MVENFRDFLLLLHYQENLKYILFDEPTAFLDVEQRLKAAKAIKRVVESRNAAAIIIDHDIVFIDYISDRAMVFDGEPGVDGHASSP